MQSWPSPGSRASTRATHGPSARHHLGVDRRRLHAHCERRADAVARCRGPSDAGYDPRTDGCVASGRTARLSGTCSGVNSSSTDRPDLPLGDGGPLLNWLVIFVAFSTPDADGDRDMSSTTCAPGASTVARTGSPSLLGVIAFRFNTIVPRTDDWRKPASDSSEPGIGHHVTANQLIGPYRRHRSCDRPGRYERRRRLQRDALHLAQPSLADHDDDGADAGGPFVPVRRRADGQRRNWHRCPARRHRRRLPVRRRDGRRPRDARGCDSIQRSLLTPPRHPRAARALRRGSASCSLADVTVVRRPALAADGADLAGVPLGVALTVLPRKKLGSLQPRRFTPRS